MEKQKKNGKLQKDQKNSTFLIHGFVNVYLHGMGSWFVSLGLIANY